MGIFFKNKDVNIYTVEEPGTFLKSVLKQPIHSQKTGIIIVSRTTIFRFLSHFPIECMAIIGPPRISSEISWESKRTVADAIVNSTVFSFPYLKVTVNVVIVC